MNCWIILLLLFCCGRNNGVQSANEGCGCECHDHCHNSCIQPRMYEDACSNMRRERDCDCDGTVNERMRDKWMPYSECDEDERRESRESYRNERSCDCK